MNNKKSNNKVISLVIVFILLTTNIFIAFFMTQSSVNGGNTISEDAKLNEFVTIKNDSFNLSIKANYVDDNYIVHDNLMNKNKKYIRVNLTVTNNDEEAEEAMILLGFKLLDNYDSEIAICDPVPSFADDPIPRFVEPNGSETFSVYFDTDTKDWKTLLIRGDIDGGSETDAYINLRNE